MSKPVPENYNIENNDEQWLTRVVVDTSLRKFYLYSNEGEQRTVVCDTIKQFMDVLDVVRKLVDEQFVIYAEPLTKNGL